MTIFAWRSLLLCAVLGGTLCLEAAEEAPLKVATFDIDATPPVGSLLAYDPCTNHWDLSLRARGIVMTGAGEPVVLCAVDWIGIANESNDAFRSALAEAAGTSADRVAVHTLHQHDAPECDFGAEKLLKDAGASPRQYEGEWQRRFLKDLASAVAASRSRAVPVTEIGLGQAVVHEVASNRRVMGPDGKVKAVRYTSTADPKLRAEPEGLIDPVVSLVSFWSSNKPVAVLSYYATHPQSYYRTGVPNPDFPGVARFLRQMAVPEALHIHFDGAGGNIGAGKYNDGSMENRRLLGERLAEGMRQAWLMTHREPVKASDVGWRTVPVVLPAASHLEREKMRQQLRAQEATFLNQGGASRLAFVERSQGGNQTTLSCLSIGRTRILHMPGELFVEYQLAAKKMRPDLFVCMASYGDYGPWYIGTAIAYEQGGYETSPGASNVSPAVEPVLLKGLKALLEVSSNP